MAKNQTKQTAKKDGPINVIATRDGIYGDYRKKGRGSTYRKKGDAFIIANEDAFSKRWMKRGGKGTPEVVDEDELSEGSEPETLHEMGMQKPQGNR